MGLTKDLKTILKAERKRGALWVRALDVARLLKTAERRSLLWTRLVHADAVHQTTPYTCEDRYPELFDLAARLRPDAERIWSFGCSTGAELVALRQRFRHAEIVGSEINPRSRRLASKRLASDALAAVVKPDEVAGTFDIIFAMAVLQREPHKVVEMEVEDLSAHYSFERFDTAVHTLVEHLRTGGLLCVANAHYRVEDSAAARALEPVARAPAMEEPLFGPHGRRLRDAVASTMFEKWLEQARGDGSHP